MNEFNTDTLGLIVGFSIGIFISWLAIQVLKRKIRKRSLNEKEN